MSQLNQIRLGKSYTHPDMELGRLDKITLRTLVFKLPFSTRKYTFHTRAHRDVFIHEMKEVVND